MALKVRSFSPEIVSDRPAKARFSVQDALQALATGQVELAIRISREILGSTPNELTAWLILGIAHHQSKNLLEAVVAFSRATKVDSTSADAWNNLGNAQRLLGDYENSIEALRQAIQIRPDFHDAHLNLARALIAAEKFGEALHHATRADLLQPGNEETLYVLAQLAWIEGRAEESVEAYQRVLARQPERSEAWSGLLMSLNYCDGVTGEAIRQVAERWAATIPHGITHRIRTPWRNDRPIRLGYVSPDFGFHPVGLRMRELLRHHDNSRVEITLYNNRITPDRVTEQIRGLGNRWRDIANLNDLEAANLIADDQIDVLVDLSGHTGSHRLGVFALKPAPLQLTWFGYFGTTGLAEIDGFVGDPLLFPPQEADHYVERPMPLPDGPFMYQPAEDLPEVAPPPCETNQYITFGSFNTLAKVGRSTIQLWSAVLRAIPDSRFLFCRLRLDDPTTQAYYADQFWTNGVDPGRVTFVGQHGPKEFYTAHAQVDILLDSNPFNGSTTILEGMLMGVPVVSRSGNRMVGHLSEQVLVRSVHPEWVATSDDDFVKTAIRLASDPANLRGLRETLRNAVLTSPLCDAKRCAATLENLLQIELAKKNGI